jgi:hypothetical protein
MAARRPAWLSWPLTRDRPLRATSAVAPISATGLVAPKLPSAGLAYQGRISPKTVIRKVRGLRHIRGLLTAGPRQRKGRSAIGNDVL